MNNPRRVVGRDPLLEQLSQGLRLLRQGSGHALLLEAPAGAGKTAVLDAVTNSIPAEVVVRSGRAQPFDRVRPFGLITDVLGIHAEVDDPARQAIAQRLDAAPAVPVGQARTAIVEAIVDLVERDVQSRPLALVLDDLQWADPASSLALNRLATRVAELPLGIVGAARPDDGDATGDERALSGATVLPVEPLDPISIERLAALETGGRPGERLTELLSATDGNPLLVLSLLRGLRDEQRLHRSGDIVDVVGEQPPVSFEQAVLRRAGALSDDARQLLEVAAVLSSFALADVAAASGETRAAAEQGLAAAVRAGLLRREDDRFTFAHELVRAAIYDAIPVRLRGTLHRRAAAALERGGHPLTEVAVHAGMTDVDAETLAVLWRAAAAVAGTDPGVAADLLSHAAATPDSDERRRVNVERVQLLRRAGRIAEARDLGHSVLVEGAAADEAAVRLALVRTSISVGDVPSAMEHAQQGIPVAADAGLRAALMAELALCLVFVDAAEGIALARAALDTAPRDDAVARFHGLAALSLGLWITRRDRETGDVMDAAVELLALDRAGEILATGAAIALAGPLIDADDPRGADIVDMIQRRCEETGVTSLLPLCHARRCAVFMRAGRWDDALAEGTVHDQLRAATGVPSVFDVAVAADRATVAAYRGDEEDAELTLSAARVEVDAVAAVGMRHWYGPEVVIAEAALELMRGNAATAFELLHQGWQDTATFGDRYRVLYGPPLARLAHRLERSDVVREVADELDALAKGLPVPGNTAAALVARGLLERRADLLDAAAELYQRRPFDLALTLVDKALVLTACGQRHDATTAAQAALATMAQLRAPRLEQLVRADLRAAGLRVHVAAPRATARSGWDSLTSTERRITDLVAEGRRNAEVAAELFISVRTVETHLTSIYRKLGLANRSTLTREVHRRRGSATA